MDFGAFWLFFVCNFLYFWDVRKFNQFFSRPNSQFRCDEYHFGTCFEDGCVLLGKLVA